jgi:hypothetical protein
VLPAAERRFVTDASYPIGTTSLSPFPRVDNGDFPPLEPREMNIKKYLLWGVSADRGQFLVYV